MPGHAVQFRGIQNVLAAFDNRSVEAWSISQGKQFLFKGIGSEDLKTLLDSLYNGNDVIYTLRVYEDIDDAKKIKSNTPDDGSFNFRLQEAEGYEERTMRSGGIWARLQQLEQDNADLKKQLEETEEEDEEETGLPSIGAIAENPKLLDPYFELADKIIGMFNKNRQPQHTAIGHLPASQTETMSKEDQQQQQPIKDFTESEYLRLGKALVRIYQHEPNTIDVIEKIADRLDNGEEIPLTKLVNISGAKLTALKAFM